MFDIGFWELSLIMIVALLVVGPQRLPKLVRTVGLWMGKMRTIVRNVKSDIDRELAAEELKRTLAEQAESAGLHEIIEEARSIGKDAEQMLNQPVASVTESTSSAPQSQADTAIDKPNDKS